MSIRLDPNYLPISSLSVRGASSQGSNAQIEDLPQNLFDIIIHFSTLETLQALASVSKGMRVKVLKGVNYDEPHYIRLFIKMVAEQLEKKEFNLQKCYLTTITKKIAFHNFDNLKLLKGYVLGLREEFLRGIRDVDEETQNELERDIKPFNFFEKVFALSSLERKFDKCIEAAFLTSETEKNNELTRISIDLVKAGLFDKAIEVAYLLPSKHFFSGNLRSDAFTRTSIALAQAGLFDRAIEVAHSISCDIERGNAFHAISCSLTAVKLFDRAIEVAHLISCGKDDALRVISYSLTAVKLFDRAIEVAHSISCDIERDDAFCAISCSLTAVKLFDKAIEVAHLIPSEISRSFVLSDISRGLAEEKLFDKAIEVAHLIPSEISRSLVLSSIPRGLAEVNFFDRAIEIDYSNPFSFETDDGDTFCAIS